MLAASDYRPPLWLRNSHVQSLLGGSPFRRARGARLLARLGALTQEYLVDGGEGVRLHGLYSTLPDLLPRGLALLLHGWEGSTESSYMRLTAAHLLRRGYDVFRLNFRDHGDSHHLNEAIFHSNRIDEVVHAACDIARRFWPEAGAQRPLVAAGYSLGGNFALRLAARASAAGLPLARVASVCPVLDPAKTMTWMEERAPPIYLRHFEKKWRESLQRKRALFPQQHDFDDATLRLRMRELTQWLVQRHTDFGTLDNYFDGYSVAGERLAALDVPADILTAADDPVIPVEDFHALSAAPGTRVEIARWGGHCGFLENLRMDGFAERWVAERLTATPDPGEAGARG
ncbi:YheT family hydrolase [Luteimonas aquatica]|uniref:YheT family hydrolase n=1 Tax=Luteimonas aquatica TaxID=450364 RepID=UPI001F57FEDD|nr:alpha/beta fold hydrolase [Luteimonas aquatica]